VTIFSQRVRCEKYVSTHLCTPDMGMN
jgi:hypothetical protein